MARSGSVHQEDFVILTRAVESVLRKLIRFFVGQIPLVKLQEMIRSIYVEEAENRIRKKHPQKNVSLTKLALLSGLDTRTLTKIRNSASFRQPFHISSSFLKEFTPGVMLLDVWSSKPPWFDPVKGQARVLKITGDESSFEALFYETVKSRGITANSLLLQLAESGSVKINAGAGTVSLVRLLYLPSALNDQLEAIVVGFSAIGNHVDTVIHNLNSIQSEDELFYQRGAWTYRLPYSRLAATRKELREVLEKCDLAARKVLKKSEVQNSGPNQLTAGVGLFYFEEAE
jgi:Family of unknown function (DUF6502)